MRDMRACKKICNNSGASILMALVVFLAAAMVSVVIISASLTALKRVNDDRDEREKSLAVNSAARLVAECLADTTIIEYEIETKPAEGHVGETTTDVSVMGLGDFKEILEDMYTAASVDGDYSAITRNYTLTYTASDDDSTTDDDEIMDCLISMSMNRKKKSSTEEYTDHTDKYRITGEIILKPQGVGNADIANKVNFSAYIPVDPVPVYNTDTTTDPSKIITTKTTTYRWNGLEIK